MRLMFVPIVGLILSLLSFTSVQGTPGDPGWPWPEINDVLPHKNMQYPRFIGSPCDVFGIYPLPPESAWAYITLYDIYYSACPNVRTRLNNMSWC